MDCLPGKFMPGFAFRMLFDALVPLGIYGSVVRIEIHGRYYFADACKWLFTKKQIHFPVAWQFDLSVF